MYADILSQRLPQQVLLALKLVVADLSPNEECVARGIVVYNGKVRANSLRTVGPPLPLAQRPLKPILSNGPCSSRVQQLKPEILLPCVKNPSKPM